MDSSKTSELELPLNSKEEDQYEQQSPSSEKRGLSNSHFRHLKGVILISSAVVVFWSAQFITEYLSRERGVKSFQLLSVLSLTMYIGNAALMKFRGVDSRAPEQFNQSLFLRAVLGSVSILINYWAISFMDLSTFLALFHIHPIISCFIGMYKLGEPIHFAKFVGVLVGFIGVVCVVHPPFLFGSQEDAMTPLEIMLPIIAAFATAGAIYYIRKIGPQIDYMIPIDWMSQCSFLVSFLICFLVSGLEPYEADTFIINVCLGGVFLMGQALLTNGAQTEKLSTTMSLSFIQVGLSFISDSIWYHKVINPIEIVGVFMIFAALVTIVSKKD